MAPDRCPPKAKIVIETGSSSPPPQEPEIHRARRLWHIPTHTVSTFTDLSELFFERPGLGFGVAAGRGGRRVNEVGRAAARDGHGRVARMTGLG